MKRRLSLTEIRILLRILLIAGVLAALLAWTAAGATYVVDDDGGADFTSIQAAVDAASEGDTIEVRSGTYVENVDVGKRLTLRGDGADVVTVQAANSNDHVFDVTANWVNISGFKAYGATASGKAGIYVGDGIAHSNISNSAASNNYYGIYLDRSSNNILTENTPSKNYMHGIRLAYSSNNTLLNNTVSSDNGCAILLYASADNRLINNDFSNSFQGIFMYASSNDNLVSGNTASGNWQGGIYLEGNNNTITGNTASNNGDFGILLESSSINTLYHNNLDGNTNNNAYDDGTNQWDSGSKGNYYSNYVGIDSNGDGIGDTPHSIPGGSNEDRYPLMEPWIEPTPSRPIHNINKGTDYTTIQAAIDDASPGDEIHVDSGTYYENVVVNKKVVIHGINLPTITLPAFPENGANVLTVTVDEIRIDGFKIVGKNICILEGIDDGHFNSNTTVVIESNNSIFSNNSISGGPIGLGLYNSNNTTFINNNITNIVNDENPKNITVGIMLYNSNDNILYDNDIIFNNLKILSLGIVIGYSNNNNISSNNLANNSGGILVEKSDYNIVENNFLINNSVGIYIASYHGFNEIKFNNIINNEIGISSIGVDDSSKFHHNNFIDNNQQAISEGINYWNSGYPSGGNYWSDYIGDDLNNGPNQDQPGSDGIGDTPYPIPGGSSEDRYPLMNPWTASPLSGKIAFASFSDGNQEVYVMNANGTGDPIDLTNRPDADDGDPTWSPDGTQIAFSSNRSGNWTTYIMNADGSDQVCLLEGVYDAWGPAWSPDGTKIAVACKINPTDDFEIYTVDIQSRALTQVTYNISTDCHPTWSPDSHKIAFTSNRDNNQEIYVADLLTGTKTNLTYNSSNDDYPEWSPDGSMIAFVSERDGNLEIYSMDITSKAITRLTYSESTDKHAQWSPDGQEFVFISDRDGGDMDVYVMKADGTGIMCLIDWDGNETHPTWSPDHSSLPAYSVGEGAPDTATQNHFIDAYNRNGGLTVLGSPTTDVHRAWGYLVQDFPGASGYAGGIIIYNPYKNYAYYIHGAIWERYYGLGGPGAETDIEFELGPPVSDINPYIHTQPPEVSSHGTQFRYQNFEGGALNHNIDTGEVFEVHGAIFAKWKELGYAAHDLGLVTSDEREAALSPIGTEGRVSNFEGGHIHWHRTGGHSGKSYETHGAIDAVYCAEGGSGGRLGFPVSNEYVNPSGYLQSDFEGGYITTTDGVNYQAYDKGDTTPPTLTIEQPIYLHDNMIDLSVMAYDVSGILNDEVEIMVISDGLDYCSLFFVPYNPTTQRWSASDIPVGYGNNEIKVSVQDNNHNIVEETTYVYLADPDFSFVHITDVHIDNDWIDLPEGILDENGNEIEIERYRESVSKFGGTLREVNKEKPAFVLDTGDCVEYDDKDLFKNYTETLDRFIDEHIDIYHTSGNHDRRNQLLEPTDLTNYNDIVKPTNGPKTSLNDGYDDYYFDRDGYRFIGLESGADWSQVIDLSPEGSGLKDPQITKLMEMDKNIPKIIFMHHPAINKGIDTSGIPLALNYCPEYGGNDDCIAFNRCGFIEYCTDYNVQLVLTGHTHKSYEAQVSNTLFIQTPSATKDKDEFNHGYRIIDIKDGKAVPQEYTPTSTQPYWRAQTHCPVHLHAYDSQGRHTGLNASGGVETNIPDSFYIGRYNYSNPNETETILLYNTTEEYRFEIVANLTKEEKASPEIESFNFTVEQQTDDTRTTIAHLSVPLTENTTATLPVNITTTAYTMEIDNDGDSIIDETIDPDFTETNYAPIASIIAPETGSIYNVNEPVEFNGTGRDPEDGILTNFSLVWYSDINGAIGAGERFSTGNLSCGVHRITLMVNDSVDLVDTESVIITVVDYTPPSSITNLHHNSGNTWLNWTWTNPPDPDFNHTEIYLDGTLQTNTSAEFFNATDLVPDTMYTIGTRTVDINGNINIKWVNDTAMTTGLYNITILQPIDFHTKDYDLNVGRHKR